MMIMKNRIDTIIITELNRHYHYCLKSINYIYFFSPYLKCFFVNLIKKFSLSFFSLKIIVLFYYFKQFKNMFILITISLNLYFTMKKIKRLIQQK